MRPEKARRWRYRLTYLASAGVAAVALVTGRAPLPLYLLWVGFAAWWAFLCSRYEELHERGKQTVQMLQAERKRDLEGFEAELVQTREWIAQEVARRSSEIGEEDR